MKTVLCGILLLVSPLCNSVAADRRSAGEVTLTVSQLSRTGIVTVNLVNSSKAPVKVWDEDNSWGAAHWRVFLVRNGKVETFYENPRRKFTVNVPSFKEIKAGGNVQRTLDLNGGNWCGLGYCAAFNEHGFGGRSISFERADTLIVAYDVPATYDVEARKLGVWNGVAATLATVE
jgi:hypothetical protein